VHKAAQDWKESGKLLCKRSSICLPASLNGNLFQGTRCDTLRTANLAKMDSEVGGYR
jgi:hypothetical protein